MLRRSWSFAIVAFLAFAVSPAWGQSSYDPKAVYDLSKKIDAYLAKVWQKAKVTPAVRAEDHVFFRRLNLDLVGRIPDLIEIDDFLGEEDRTPGFFSKAAPAWEGKRWRWVDRMLDGKEHPRHFANVWRNNIIGTQTNPQFQFFMGQFENWLRSRIEQNKTLNAMVRELLTAQNAGAMNPGFGRNDFNNQESPQLFFQVNENKAENLAGATSRVFLGVKIECAQCHKHPFAKWTQEQFWEFAAFYSTPAFNPKGPKGPAQPVPGFQPGREIVIPGTDKVVKAKFLNGKEPEWGNSNNSRKTLAEWVTDKDNPYFAKAMADHLWTYLMGVSLLEPILEPSDDYPMTHPDLLNDLAEGLREHNFDAKFLIRAIVHSDAYQRASGGAKLADKEDYQLFVRMPMRALSPEQIYDSLIMATMRGKDPSPNMGNQPFFNPNQLQSPRAQFLNKFQTQDRRHEPQTSILQALFMMNGKFLHDRARLENNVDLQTLATQKTPHEQRVKSLYMMVLSRPPRDNEIHRLVPYLERSGATGNLGDAISDIYWALLNSSEFLLNH